MDREDIELTGTKCEHCGDDLENGARALCLEDSVVGKTGFVSLPRQDWLLFCCEQHLLEHHIPGEFDGDFSARIPPLTCEATTNEFTCDDCGSALGYGRRVIRLQDSNIDGVGFVPLTNRDDWFLFCSKKCGNSFLDETNRRRPRFPPRLP